MKKNIFVFFQCATKKGENNTINGFSTKEKLTTMNGTLFKKS